MSFLPEVPLTAPAGRSGNLKRPQVCGMANDLSPFSVPPAARVKPARESFGSRVPAELPPRVDRDHAQLAQRCRAVPDFGVGDGRLAALDAVDEILPLADQRQAQIAGKARATDGEHPWSDSQIVALAALNAKAPLNAPAHRG